MSKDMESALFGGNLSRRRLLKSAAVLGGAYALDRLLPKNAEAGNGWQSYFGKLQVTDAEAAQRKVPYIRQQFTVLNGNGQPTDLFVLRGVSDYQTGAAGIYRSKLVGSEYSQFEPMSVLPLKTTYKAWAGYSGRGLVTIAVGASAKPKFIGVDVGAVAISYNEGKNWNHTIFASDTFTDIKSLDTSGAIFFLDGGNASVGVSGPRGYILRINPDYPQISPRITPVEGFTGPIESLAIIEAPGKLSAGDVVTVYTVESQFRFRKNSLDITTGKVLSVEDINYPPAGASVITNVYKENGVTKGLIMVNWFSQQVFSYFDVQKNEGVLYNASDWKSQFSNAREIYVNDVVKIGDRFYVSGYVGVENVPYGWLGELSAGGLFKVLRYENIPDNGGVYLDAYRVNGIEVLDWVVDPVGKRLVSLTGAEYIWANKGLEFTLPKEFPKEEKAFMPLTGK